LELKSSFDNFHWISEDNGNTSRDAADHDVREQTAHFEDTNKKEIPTVVPDLNIFQAAAEMRDMSLCEEFFENYFGHFFATKKKSPCI
jgi:hypothetical protein